MSRAWSSRCCGCPLWCGIGWEGRYCRDICCNAHLRTFSWYLLSINEWSWSWSYVLVWMGIVCFAAWLNQTLLDMSKEKVTNVLTAFSWGLTRQSKTCKIVNLYAAMTLRVMNPILAIAERILKNSGLQRGFEPVTLCRCGCETLTNWTHRWWERVVCGFKILLILLWWMNKWTKWYMKWIVYWTADMESSEAMILTVMNTVLAIA